jgi:hypothetical protein
MRCYPMMRTAILPFLALALAGAGAACGSGPPADLSAPGGPGALVSTQTPPGIIPYEGSRRPVQTRNSLPPGAGFP